MGFLELQWVVLFVFTLLLEPRMKLKNAGLSDLMIAAFLAGEDMVSE